MTNNKPTQMYEYTANFHQHTNHSDGAATHEEVIQAGIEANLNIMVFTDHNVYVTGVEGWYHNTLVLMGVEVNDTAIEPEINHYLCLGVDGDLNDYAANPQGLINAVNECGGVGFIAHPFERPSIPFNEYAIPWLNWDVSGYTGLEIWNYMSEFKAHLTGKAKALRVALSPDSFITGPFPETLLHWDKLMQNGQKVVAIGGSDAHGRSYSMGPLTRTLFPYKDLFSAVRTHLLIEAPLSKDVAEAKQQALTALRQGHCFVAYDHIGDTSGFQFSATNQEEQIIFTPANIEGQTIQGDEITFSDLKMIELQITTPLRAEIRLLKDGQIIEKVRGTSLTYLASEPGVYRVECFKVYKTRWRGWIYSNPIYIRDN